MLEALSKYRQEDAKQWLKFYAGKYLLNYDPYADKGEHYACAAVYAYMADYMRMPDEKFILDTVKYKTVSVKSKRIIRKTLKDYCTANEMAEDTAYSKLLSTMPTDEFIRLRQYPVSVKVYNALHLLDPDVKVISEVI